MPYPESFPLAQASILLAYLRGNRTYSLGEVVECAYDLVGYALGQFLPVKERPLIVGQAVTVVTSDESLAGFLETLVDSHKAGVYGAVQVNWIVVLPYLLKVIDTLLHQFMDNAQPA